MSKKTIILSESDLIGLIKKIIKESTENNVTINDVKKCYTNFKEATIPSECIKNPNSKECKQIIQNHIFKAEALLVDFKKGKNTFKDCLNKQYGNIFSNTPY